MFTQVARVAVARNAGSAGYPVHMKAVEYAGVLSYEFYQQDVAASQAAVALNIVSTDHTEILMPVGGHIVGIAVQSNDACTAGTLTAEVTKNGVGVGLSTGLDTTDTQYKAAMQEAGVDVFAALDRIGVDITTDAGWLPVTADILVTVFVALGGLDD